MMQCVSNQVPGKHKVQNKVDQLAERYGETFIQ